jgi:hypothetical protein
MRRVVLYSAILGFVLTVLIYGILVDFDLVRLVPAVVLMILASAMGGLVLGATIPLAESAIQSSPKQSAPTINTPVAPVRGDPEITLSLPVAEYLLLENCLRWLEGCVTIPSDAVSTSSPTQRGNSLLERITNLQERVQEAEGRFVTGMQQGSDWEWFRFYMAAAHAETGFDELSWHTLTFMRSLYLDLHSTKPSEDA